jgi:glycosyltransferase involved in cell wall biosynthesis
MVKIMVNVSIIVRTKDRELLLKRAISSILAQTYDNWEAIIVNNGGNIYTIENVLSSLTDDDRHKFKVIDLTEPHYMEYATNIGIQNSTGEYIAILDDDDTWDPDFLYKCVSYLDNMEYNGVVTKTIINYETIEGDIIKVLYSKPLNQHLKKVNLWRIARHNLFTTNSFVYRREIVDRLGQYNESLPVLGDWEFNIRFLLFNYKIGIINESLSYYHKRIRKVKNSTLNNSDLNLHLDFDWKIRKNFFRQYFFSARCLWAIWLVFNGGIVKIKSCIKHVKNLLVGRCSYE